MAEDIIAFIDGILKGLLLIALIKYVFLN